MSSFRPEIVLLGGRLNSNPGIPSNTISDMKKWMLMTAVLAMASASAYAGGFRHHGGYGWGHGGYGWHRGPSVSFVFGGGYPSYAPFYSYPYPSYGYDYGYNRPNYALGGTLLGALTGGLIGNSIHHQGWEGAGIGAAAGLLLGGLAEHNARARERTYYSAPVVDPSSYVAAAPVANNAPAVTAAPPVQSAPYKPATAMSSANSLFGR